MAPLRIGIAGRRGAAFYAGLRAIPDVRIEALCDLDSEWLAAEAQAQGVPRTFTRFVEMLDHVDAVVVATPMQVHAAQSVLALEAGKSVLSEVTAAVNLDECWRIWDAARRARGVYMMAENYCYLRDNVLVGELVREGLFGDLYYAEGEYLHDVKAYHHTADGGRTWRYYWQVGVPGITYGTHSLGPAMQWMKARHPGERAETVVCLGSGVHTDPEHPHDDTSVALVKLASGKLIRIRLDMMSNRPHQMVYYSLQGTHGVYEASRDDRQSGLVWFGENRAGEHREWRSLRDFDDHLPALWRNPPEEALRAGHGGGDYFIVKDWIDAVRGERPPAITFSEALEWTAVGLCSTLSLQNGGVPIRVPDFSPDAEPPLLLSAPPVEP
jgi:predicted dehydrogenase